MKRGLKLNLAISAIERVANAMPKIAPDLSQPGTLVEWIWDRLQNDDADSVRAMDCGQRFIRAFNRATKLELGFDGFIKLCRYIRMQPQSA